MESKLASLIFLAVMHKGFVGAWPHPSNGLRECHKNLSLLALEVLPGGGWDNLRNQDMGRIMNFSYSQCQTTEDGVYLIPDEVFVIPQKMTAVESGSDFFEHWLNHTSSTSQTINTDASFLPVLNAKFSADNQRSKNYQVRDDAVTSRVQVRNHIYIVEAFPDFTLDSRFTQQVKEIADALLMNNTRHATFLSEMMVVDYGTHVITSVDAGATLEQEDHVEHSFYINTEKTKLSRSASLNFFKIIKFDMDTKESHESSETEAYKTSLTHSLTQSHGGPAFYPGITLKTWQESTLNNLVAIDRSGLPLHYILNSATLPDLPEATIEKVAHSVRKAIQLYYDVNTRPGCVDSKSQNFNFQANVDDNSCSGPATNLSFGGIYQTCTPIAIDVPLFCAVQEVKNPDTGAFSCREPYFPILLQSVVIEEHYNTTDCYEECEGFFFIDCQTICNVIYHVRSAEVNTHWCTTDKKTKPFSGYLFGGLYSPNVENPITRSKGCPHNFFSLKFLSKDFIICLSKDYEQASSLSVPFGGFFSCRAGNPLASSQFRCPPEFSQHLLTIDDGCQIMYCVKSGAFTGGPLKPINLPPFTHPALIRKVNNTMPVMITEGDQLWLRKGNSNSWQQVKSGQVKNVRHMSESGKTTVGVGVTIIIILVSVIACIVKRKFGDSEAFNEIRRGGYETFPNAEPDSRV
ncbi:macrophage-expressed gene 1 protein-like [Alosa alosa]|uniref:macrophage-expressed gene 1 protein-like n=1 Tax=Alosa alosa TaxID=278164 RepID=UPI0020150830|nr:macrophage-expressed gene 1 protein-like [Alosa alosa]